MISPLSPYADLITVASIEQRLTGEGCVKVTHGMKYNCRWRAPNGRHFQAPNPNVYSLVPSDTMERVLRRLALVMKLPPPPTAEQD